MSIEAWVYSLLKRALRSIASTLKLKGFSFLGSATFLSLVLILNGCGANLSELDLNISSNTSFSWYGPSVTDRGVITTVSYDGSNNSFNDYRVSAGSDRASLMAALYDGTNHRGMGRIFSLLGGWATSQFSIVDSAGVDIVNVCVAVDQYDQVLGVTSDGATSADTQSIFYNGAWTNKTTAFMQPSTSLPNSSHPDNGYSTAMAYDSTDGRFYLAQINLDTAGTSPNNNLYINYYLGGWGASGTETLLSADAVQADAAFDGYGTTAVWRTQSANTSDFGVGDNHNCILSLNGDVRCWGTNSSGQLGDASTTSKTYPVTATGLDITTGVMPTHIASAGSHNCVRLSTGAVQCWGLDTAGQIGDGQTCSGGASCTSATTVTTVDGTTEDAVTVAAGNNHSCAVISGGGYRCWGDNASGQLGDSNSPTDSTTPACGANPCVNGTTYTDVQSGGDHTCLIDNSGAVTCFGENADGQLGDNNSPTDADSPQATGVAGATLLALGENHSCAYDAGTLKCWGDNDYGQLGIGSAADNDQPQTVSGLTSITTTLIAAGDDHTCIIFSGGSTTGGVKCWGRNDNGQLGIGETSGPDTSTCTGSTACSTTPVSTLTFGSGVTAIAIEANGNKTCVLTTEQGVYCWGDGNAYPSKVEDAVDCTTGSCLFAAWSDDNSFLDLMPISSYNSTVQSFDLATDTKGNAVVTYIQNNVGHQTCASTSPATTNCAYRVYASARNILGQWTGPTRLDSEFHDQQTAHYQNGGVGNVGGIDYYTPQVASIGQEKFLAVYVVIDNSARTSGIYSKEYILSQGWSGALLEVNKDSLSGSSDQYRLANDIELVGSTNGTALLMAHYVTTNGAAVGNREYGYKIFRYDNGSWSLQQTLDGRYACAANSANCVTAPKISGFGFSGGQGGFVFQAPASLGSSNKRLWEIHYR